MGKRKWLLTSLVFVFTIILSVGCSSDEASDDNGETSNGNGEPSENFNETGFPIVDEQITLSMFGQRSPVNGPFEEMPPFIEYEKMSNINIEWETVPAEGYAEQKNLLFGSNDLPDAFYKGRLTHNDILSNGYNGVLIPLNDLIEQYAPNIKALFEEYPAVKDGTTAPDGNIYSIPGVVTLDAARTQKYWINQKWLDALNLEIPETTDEFIDVLTAFRDEDPNGNGEQDEIPFTARNAGQLTFAAMGSFGLVRQMGYYLDVKNDNVNIWITDDKYKEFLKYLNRLYTEGLLDSELFTHTGAEYVSKMGSGNAGFFFDQTSGPFESIEDTYTGIGQLEGPNGDKIVDTWPVSRDFGAFAITSENEYPEATMRWIDYFYGMEGSTLIRYGIEGEHHVKTEDGNAKYVEELTGPDGAQLFPVGGGGAPHWINEGNSYDINPPKVQEAQAKLDPDLQEIVLGPPLFDEETTQEVNTLKADIDTFIDEYRAKFISGEQSFDEWDNYVSTLENMGLDRLEEIYQEAYDSIYK